MKNNQLQVLITILGILVLMSFIPGEGTKTSDASKAAYVETNYSCSSNSDCPTCVLAGTSNLTANYTSELDSKCIAGKCQQSDACLIWDCKANSGGNCQSVRQTLLDNTIGFFNKHIMALFLLIAAIAIYIILALDKRGG